jgi:16S rRNA G966 N2-methylase RsmD
MKCVSAREAIGRVLLRPMGVPHAVPVKFRELSGAVGNRDEATHLIHRYPAKMFHRIPRTILDAIEPVCTSVILDPFCGSGTVLLEGLLRGHVTIGLDINPLAQLISRVKTTLYNVDRLTAYHDSVMRKAQADRTAASQDACLDFWFHPVVKSTLYHLRRAIDAVPRGKYRDFFLIALTSIVRKVSLADPSIPPPVKLRKERAERANERYRKSLEFALTATRATVFEQFAQAVRQNIRRASTLHSYEQLGSAVVLHGNRHAAATGLEAESVDIILTSPPYCGAQKYVRSLKLEMRWLGLGEARIADIDRNTLGTERVSRARPAQPYSDRTLELTILKEIQERNPVRALMAANYVKYITDFSRECRRVIRPGGNIFVTFGTSRIAGIEVDMSAIFVQAAEDAGLSMQASLVDSIPSRGLITKRHSTAGRIDDERVVWLRG